MLFFLHIPKAAGSTFRSVLSLGYLGQKIFDVGPGNGEDFLKLDDSDVSEIQLVRGHFSFGLHTKVNSAYRYITFLRDPIQRVISLYQHDRKSPGGVNHEAAVSLTLREFVEHGCYRDELNNGQVRRIAGVDPEFGHCEDWMLEKALDNIDKHFAAVGLVEFFDESLWLMHEQLDWKFPPVYVPAMVGSRDSLRIDQDAISIIRDQNSLDLQLYEKVRERLLPKFQSKGFRRRCRLLRHLNSVCSMPIRLRRMLHVVAFT